MYWKLGKLRHSPHERVNDDAQRNTQNSRLGFQLDHVRLHGLDCGSLNAAATGLPVSSILVPAAACGCSRGRPYRDFQICAPGGMTFRGTLEIVGVRVYV